MGQYHLVCDHRPFEERPTFASRDEAARAERDLIAAKVARADLLAALKIAREHVAGSEQDIPGNAEDLAMVDAAIAKAGG